MQIKEEESICFLSVWSSAGFNITMWFPVKYLSPFLNELHYITFAFFCVYYWTMTCRVNRVIEFYLKYSHHLGDSYSTFNLRSLHIISFVLFVLILSGWQTSSNSCYDLFLFRDSNLVISANWLEKRTFYLLLRNYCLGENM